MSSNKIKFIVEEDFKTEDNASRINTLQNLFIKVIKNCESIRNASSFEITHNPKEKYQND